MKQHNHANSLAVSVCALLVSIALVLSGCQASDALESQTQQADSVQAAQTTSQNTQSADFSLDQVPAYSGSASVQINGNVPYFSSTDSTLASGTKTFSSLDQLGRCGVAFACIGPETMPQTERGSISSVHPAGWHSSYYDCVEGGSLYNRCHLVAFCLSGENANERNLITGTRYLNTQGMLPFEEKVADYIDTTQNHVLYRVTPVFSDDELVARGVLMEARSVEDSGAGISFCVYCYNVQPGISITYATGDNQLDDSEPTATTTVSSTISSQSRSTETFGTYVLNTKSRKFHTTTCSSAAKVSPANREDYSGSRSALLEEGYTPCGQCNP